VLRNGFASAKIARDGGGSTLRDWKEEINNALTGD
jgi:hypothetical protein